MLMEKIEKVFKDAGLISIEHAIQYSEPRVWIALLAVPSKERASADWLRRSRVPAYWPNFVKQVAIGSGRSGGRGSRRAVPCAIIPGYIFMPVRPHEMDPWHVVHQTPGLHGYIRDAHGRPATMTNNDVETIRKIEGGLNLPPPEKPVHSFNIGRKVRFADDLMGRWPAGKVSRLADDGRIGVDISLLGRTVMVTVYPHQIEAM